MAIRKKILLCFAFVIVVTDIFSQQLFSVASDAGLQHNFKKEQRYWAVGHTTQAIFHLTPKEGIYTWFSFFSNGKFKNKVTATAKSILTTPQQIEYVNSSRMGLKQFSIGYRRYFKGTPDAEEGWNLYGYAGFGIEFGRVLNSHSTSIDSALYNVPVRNGEAHFKRLSADFGLGWEVPIGGDYYLYSEARLWVPTTDYPSKYIFVNDNAPLVGMLVAGIRIVF